MGTLTLSGIRTIVRNDLNESDTTLLPDATINYIANDGYKDVAAKALCYESKITKNNIAASEKIIDLRANSVIRINYVEYKTGTTEGGTGALCVFPQVFGHDQIDGYSPQFWFQWNTFLVLEPPPDVSTYDLEIYAACYPAAAMSADGDTPTNLPLEFHEDVLTYTLAYVCLKLKRWAEFAMFYNRYISSVQRKRHEYIVKQTDGFLLTRLPSTVTMVKR
jgi:hypothetical protein